MTRVEASPEKTTAALASGRVTELVLDVPRGKFDVAAFVATRHLDRIRFLAMDGRVDPASLEILLNCEALQQLERLTMWSISSPKAGGILARSTLRSLRYLDLSCGVIGRHGLAELLASPVLARVETLELAQCRVDGKALAKLASATTLANLVQLSLGENAMTSAGLKILARAKFAKTLRRLNLYSNKIDGTGLSALAKFPRLDHLSLSGNDLRDAAMPALARALPRTLEHLALDCSAHLGPAGVLTFARAATLPKLATLDLAYVEGAETIVHELRATLPALRRVLTGTPDRDIRFPDTGGWI